MRNWLTRGAWPHVGAVTILLALALLFLHTAPARLGDRVIGGGGDALLECWTLCWDVHFLGGGAPSLFDANICHPEKTSLAFADHLFTQSLLFLPLYELTGNQALAYNLLILLTLVLNGFGAWLCARLLGLPAAASLLAAVLFAFYPNRLFEIPHLHVLSSQWLPFSFYFLLRYLRRRSGGAGWLAAFTVCSLAAILSSFYQALFWLVLVLITVTVSFFARRLGWRRLASLAAAGLLIVLGTIPFARPYFAVSKRYGVVRSIEDNLKNSARPGDFLQAPRNSLLYGRPDAELKPGAEHPGRERPLFPGLLFTLLLSCGVVSLFIRGRSAGEAKSLTRERLILLLTAGTALLLSFGPALSWGSGAERTLIPLPYGLLYHWVPGIKGLRMPARMVLPFHFAGALLAAYGLQRVVSRLKSGRAAAITLAACVLVFLEAAPAKSLGVKIENDRTMSDAYRELRRMPRGTVLLELPNHEHYQQYAPMYYSTFHFHPLANGRSGIIPPETRRLFQLIDPDNPYGLGPALLDHALETGINTILLHRSWNTLKQNRYMITRLRALGCVEKFGEYANRDQLYRIDAARGSETDAAPVVGPVEPAEGAPIRLAAGDAFPSSLHRPMKMSAMDGRLRLGEGVHFRWLAGIPAGCWRLTLRVTAGTPADPGPPVALQVELAGVKVIDRDDIRGLNSLEGLPVRIMKGAHYRVNVLVRPAPGYQPIDVVLENARLEPVKITAAPHWNGI